MQLLHWPPVGVVLAPFLGQADMEQLFNWALPSRSDPLVRCWGEECVLFDPVSGDTHLIDTIASSVLTALSVEPISIDGLVTQLTDGFSAEEQVAARAHLATLLAALETKNLVRRVPL